MPAQAKRWAVLFALLAGTGLRIGEALGTEEYDDLVRLPRAACAAQYLAGQEQAPKTPNAVRVVDIAEPLAQLLTRARVWQIRIFIRNEKRTATRTAQRPRALHATGKKVGLHAFRRFRTETLRRAVFRRTSSSLAWPLEARPLPISTLSDWKKTKRGGGNGARRAGLGFSLVGLLGLQNVVQIDSEKAA